jgi:glycosyltransferase involved in cell wall biosynthesis
MYSGEERDAQLGISAVLAGTSDGGELYGAVLDAAAVLDALIDDNFEIIVAGDTSADRTLEILDELRVRCPDLPLRFIGADDTNPITAFAAGLEAATYDLILLIAADGQFDMRELNHFLEAIERGADVAIGYRASNATGISMRVRRWAWNALINLLFGTIARDVDCSFKLLRRTVWERVAMQPTCATFNTELLVKARRLGFRVDELPVKHLPRKNESACSPSLSELSRTLGNLWALRRGLERVQPAADEQAEREPPPARRVA